MMFVLSRDEETVVNNAESLGVVDTELQSDFYSQARSETGKDKTTCWLNPRFR